MGGYSRSLENKYVHFSVSVPTMIKGTCALPLFAAVACVLWSLAYNFEGTTRTHCKVYNFLPTISSVTAGFTPQRYIWQIGVALHAPQRLMMAVGYYSFHTSVYAGTHNELYKTAAAVNSLLHIFEVLSLVGLSMITSTDNYKVHKSLFISFMTCAVFYMLLTIVLMKWGRFGKHSVPSYLERRSLKLKTRLFIFHISVFAVAIYLFYRHNTYCEPRVYSFFAFCEYLLIVSNIAYHGMAAVDFNITDVLMVDSVSRKAAVSEHRNSSCEYRGGADSGGGDSRSGFDSLMMLV